MQVVALIASGQLDTLDEYINVGATSELSPVSLCILACGLLGCFIRLQVLQSVQLPFALLPVLIFNSSSSVMGEDFKLGSRVRYLAVLCALRKWRWHVLAYSRWLLRQRPCVLSVGQDSPMGVSRRGVGDQLVPVLRVFARQSAPHWLDVFFNICIFDLLYRIHSVSVRAF